MSAVPQRKEPLRSSVTDGATGRQIVNSSSTKIRGVERDFYNTRPRDATIKKAANDNHPHANDNVRSAGRVYRQIEPNPTHQTIDQDFNDYEDRGLSGKDSPTRGVSIDRRNLQSLGEEQGARTAQAKRRGYSNRADSRSVQAEVARRPRKGLGNKLKKLPGGPVTKIAGAVAEMGAKRIITTEVSGGLLSFGMWFHLMFQLPLALMAISALGLFAVIESIKGAIEDNILLKAAVWVIDIATKPLQWMADGLNWILENVIGLDFSVISPENIFMLTTTLAGMIGFSILLIMGIVYAVTMVDCLSGERETLKWTALIIAVCGYGVGILYPFVNVLPWFLVWLGVVWWPIPQRTGKK